MKSLIITLLMCVTCLSLIGQINGNGNIVKKQYDYTAFDKLHLVGLNGDISIEIGKPWGIYVSVDDNILPLLAFKEDKNESQLTISLNGNDNKQLYIEKTNLQIKITMPEVSVIKHSGNSNLIVTNIVGRYLSIENLAQATTTLRGSIDLLDVKNKGNGNLYANKLITKNAKIICSGNGNVEVNVANKIVAQASGNGNVVNIGKAIFESSTQSGNGSLIKL